MLFRSVHFSLFHVVADVRTKQNKINVSCVFLQASIHGVTVTQFLCQLPFAAIL